MRTSGKILATILDELIDNTRVGMMTSDIDRLARRLLQQHRAQAAFLGYQGFPAAICVSINEEIAHGIPGHRVMEAGDLVHYDFGVSYNGMITDAGKSFVLGGKPTADQTRLLLATESALNKAISLATAGTRIGDIGAAVEEICTKNNVQVVYELCGHGVGHTVHEEPTIPNYGYSGTGERLQAGWTLALEPNVSLADHDMYLSENGWTWVTKSGSLAAQFEHTVLITEGEAEILTQR